MEALTVQTFASWQANSNFRVTTAYIFELLNVTDNNFYQIWAQGQDGKVKIRVATSPDLDGVALEFEIDSFPVGGPNSNYRINTDNVFQLYNVTTNLYYTIFIGGTKENPSLDIAQEGEE